ncbi:GNAT family N-acetyltransferase [Neobacillus piezotolerans]|nr:GNAT family N-acetyltransferase [Neobacillus piezotolerans]
MELRFVKGYREDAALRESFFSLARQVFGIQFDSWYENGYWTGKYIPFSYCLGERVVANVSVSRIGLLIEGEERRGIQIGTVMVDPEFRGRGLSGKLMERVLAEFEREYDLMYLFANHSVLDFYPKFGFTRKEEHIFSLPFKRKAGSGQLGRFLDMGDERDRQLLFQLAKRRRPISSTFAATGTEELLMFYCLNVFKDCIYYFEEEEWVGIFEEQEGELHLYDLIGGSLPDITSILARIAGEETRRIIFHFTPEAGLPFDLSTHAGSEIMFVRAAEGLVLPEKIKHPITSQA